MIQVCSELNDRLEAAWSVLQRDIRRNNVYHTSQIDCDTVCVEILEVFVARYVTMSKASQKKLIRENTHEQKQESKS